MIDREKIAGLESEIVKFLSFYAQNSGLPLFLYGAGAGVHWYTDFCAKFDIPFCCILDGALKSREEKHIGGIPVKSAEDVFAAHEKATVIISAPRYRKEIAQRIKTERPLYNVFSFDPTLDVLQNVSGEDRKRFYLAHTDELETLWNELEDDFSKRTLESVLYGSVTGDCDHYANIANRSQYFPDIVAARLKNNVGGVFADIGAYTGDTLQEFLAVVGDGFKRYYAFEPDDVNFEQLYAAFKDDPKIVMLKKGVGSQNTTVAFKNDEFSEGSHVVEDKTDSDTEIEIVRLDDAISEEVNFIKMDIEGMELEALKGARETIRRYKPILAVSVYHKIEDIIELPEYIRGIAPEYKLFLRHFWDSNGTDTILFAL